MLPVYNLHEVVSAGEGMDDVVACVHVDMSTIFGTTDDGTCTCAVHVLGRYAPYEV